MSPRVVYISSRSPSHLFSPLPGARRTQLCCLLLKNAPKTISEFQIFLGEQAPRTCPLGHALCARASPRRLHAHMLWHALPSTTFWLRHSFSLHGESRSCCIFEPIDLCGVQLTNDYDCPLFSLTCWFQCLLVSMYFFNFNCTICVHYAWMCFNMLN